MKQVSLYEAKTQLSKLVDEAAAGEEIIITKNGKPKARLVCLGAQPRQEPRKIGLWNEANKNYDWEKWERSSKKLDKEIEQLFNESDVPSALDEMGPSRGRKFRKGVRREARLLQGSWKGPQTHVNRFLLDTHAFLWSVGKTGQLRPAVVSAIAEAAEVCVSVVVLWEACIKAGLGKLDLPMPLHNEPAVGFRTALTDMRFRLLTVEPEHAAAVRHLPHYHRDPFDRILMAQAMHEGLTLITHDDVFDRYGLRTLKT